RCGLVLNCVTFGGSAESGGPSAYTHFRFTARLSIYAIFLAQCSVSDSHQPHASTPQRIPAL
ncbi:hypothetical protein L9F63_006641, partial [Diploptera punctata]